MDSVVLGLWNESNEIVVDDRTALLLKAAARVYARNQEKEEAVSMCRDGPVKAGFESIDIDQIQSHNIWSSLKIQIHFWIHDPSGSIRIHG